MPDEKKGVVGRNNGELWRNLWSDEKKVWCAFPPSLQLFYPLFTFVKFTHKLEVHCMMFINGEIFSDEI